MKTTGKYAYLTALAFFTLSTCAMFAFAKGPPLKENQWKFISDPAQMSGLVFHRPKLNTLQIVSKGIVLVDISLETGKVKLSGDPNEAARVFWKAVEATFKSPCEKPPPMTCIKLDQLKDPGILSPTTPSSKAGTP